jgi:hypothetical protein
MIYYHYWPTNFSNSSISIVNIDVLNEDSNLGNF